MAGFHTVWTWSDGQQQNNTMRAVLSAFPPTPSVPFGVLVERPLDTLVGRGGGEQLFDETLRRSLLCDLRIAVPPPSLVVRLTKATADPIADRSTGVVVDFAF